MMTASLPWCLEHVKYGSDCLTWSCSSNCIFFNWNSISLSNFCLTLWAFNSNSLCFDAASIFSVLILIQIKASQAQIFAVFHFRQFHAAFSASCCLRCLSASCSLRSLCFCFLTLSFGLLFLFFMNNSHHFVMYKKLQIVLILHCNPWWYQGLLISLADIFVIKFIFS